MPTQTGEYGITFPDNTLQTTAAFGNGTAVVFTFNSSATWTRPSSGAMTRIQAWGGGGGGGGVGGGGGGGYNEVSVPTATLAATVNLTVGAGGTGGIFANFAGFGYGSPGGITLFPLAIVTATVAGTTLSVSNISSGVLSIGQTITGTGVAGGTYIKSYGTGSGGLGTYILNQSLGSLSSRTITCNLAAYGSGPSSDPTSGTGGGQLGVGAPSLGGSSAGVITIPGEPNGSYPPTPSFWNGGVGGLGQFGEYNGADSVFGGGGGAGPTGDSNVQLFGGRSVYGGAGGDGPPNKFSNGFNGGVPGGGGGGAGAGTLTNVGGNGGQGRIVITVA
jgi:hypothetical protein